MAGNNDRDVLVLEWIRKAEHDLTNAENTFLMDDDICPFDTVCFHAQQRAEKYLKAFLTFRGIPSAKSHDLNLLLRKLDDRELKAEFVRINPATGERLASVPFYEGLPSGLTWDGEALWVNELKSNRVYRISPDDGTILGYHQKDPPDRLPKPYPYGLAFDFPSE